ncbi:hypothetical protein RND71_022180 [Anisodus tanguticus]|uniref:Uncharacterized protein n=1 Tax=Anisodus tanguticus TaxID=243964 RepID=A0AAE1VDR1_9SOLA|nr:hypothetical protein RND71_022180 [Anisodus tanguticus]
MSCGSRILKARYVDVELIHSITSWTPNNSTKFLSCDSVILHELARSIDTPTTPPMQTTTATVPVTPATAPVPYHRAVHHPNPDGPIVASAPSTVCRNPNTHLRPVSLIVPPSSRPRTQPQQSLDSITDNHTATDLVPHYSSPTPIRPNPCTPDDPNPVRTQTQFALKLCLAILFSFFDFAGFEFRTSRELNIEHDTEIQRGTRLSAMIIESTPTSAHLLNYTSNIPLIYTQLSGPKACTRHRNGNKTKQKRFEAANNRCRHQYHRTTTPTALSIPPTISTNHHNPLDTPTTRPPFPKK